LRGGVEPAQSRRASKTRIILAQERKKRMSDDLMVFERCRIPADA
jgi:hypothetical protein